MILRRLTTALAVFAACACAQAQSTDRQSSLRAAFDAAQSGQLSLADAARYSNDALYPWLQATVVRKQIATAPAPQVQALLEHMGDTPAARWLRSAWLAELAGAGRQGFRAAYKPSDDLALRCADLRSRTDLPRTGAGSARPANVA